MNFQRFSSRKSQRVDFSLKTLGKAGHLLKTCFVASCPCHADGLINGLDIIDLLLSNGKRQYSVKHVGVVLC